MIARAAALAAFCLCALPAAAERELFGFLERVAILEPEIQLEAKLDTGADSSSLDATHIRRFRRGKKSWVRFLLTDPDSGETLTVERPLVRTTRIKRHSGEHQSRPVVKLTFCLGDHRREVEFSLTDRGVFNYPLLLGRNALQGIAVVDPAEAFTREPDCEEDPEAS